MNVCLPNIDGLIRKVKSTLQPSLTWHSVTLMVRFSFHNSKFSQYLRLIHEKDLEIRPTSPSKCGVYYLDLTFIKDSENKLSTKLYDKPGDFPLTVVDFPFLSNALTSSAVMVSTFHSKTYMLAVVLITMTSGCST